MGAQAERLMSGLPPGEWSTSPSKCSLGDITFRTRFHDDGHGADPEYTAPNIYHIYAAG